MQGVQAVVRQSGRRPLVGGPFQNGRSHPEAVRRLWTLAVSSALRHRKDRAGSRQLGICARHCCDARRPRPRRCPDCNALLGGRAPSDVSQKDRVCGSPAEPCRPWLGASDDARCRQVRLRRPALPRAPRNGLVFGYRSGAVWLHLEARRPPHHCRDSRRRGPLRNRRGVSIGVLARLSAAPLGCFRRSPD